MEKIDIEKIKALLHKKGASQLHFAEHIGTKAPLISAAFHNKRDIPMNKILKISEYFEVSPFELVMDDVTPSNASKSTTPHQEKVPA